MPGTYEPIATTTLSSNTSNVSFSSIPSTYTDLVLIATVQDTNAGSGVQELLCTVNSDTASNYSVTLLYGDGSTAVSSRRTSATGMYFTYGRSATSATATALVIANFMNYSNTTTYKTVLSRNGSAPVGVAADVNIWRSTAAINTITFSTLTTYKIGSTFTLYGIKAA